MPYYSDNGLSLIKSCLRKILSNCIKTYSVRFKTHYDVNKVCCNTKDKTTVLCDSFVLHDFSCPDCRANYIDKTEMVLRKVS